MTYLKLAAVGAALIISAVAVSSAQARPRHHHLAAPRVAYETGFDRHGPMVWGFMPQQTAAIAPRVHKRGRGYADPAPVTKTSVARSERYESNQETRIVKHPSGCPSTAFCGCGVAVKVFGRPVRELWLASNWFKFPHAAPAPGMVAVRNHHVFYIEAVLGNGMVLAYDPNSGGHRTRVHPRSLAGYSVRNPNGALAMR